MITRIRIESSAKTENEVKDDILNFIEEVRASSLHPHPWQEEDPGLEVQSTATGFWGRLTIKRDTGRVLPHPYEYGGFEVMGDCGVCGHVQDDPIHTAKES